MHRPSAPRTLALRSGRIYLPTLGARPHYGPRWLIPIASGTAFALPRPDALSPPPLYPCSGPGSEDVDSHTGADDHGRLGHQPLTCRLPSSNRTSKVSTGSLAGPRSTSPLSTSNSEPW